MRLTYKYLALAALITGCLAACSKMDSTYIDFTRKGSVVYVGSADSVKVHSGKNRLRLSWNLIDPSTTKAKIYWNNKSDSVIVPIDGADGKNKVDVWLNNMNEGSYSFDIYSFDRNNNKSVVVSAVGQVYGDNYIASLLSRPVKYAIYKNDTLTITWGSADAAVIGTELTYQSKANGKKTRSIPVDSIETKLADFNFAELETFDYRTLYVPDSLAVDTFYSAERTVKASGPPIEYSRKNWIASKEDYDIPTNRFASNLLDGSTSTVWHMDKTRVYPHSFSVDMGEENYVTGFFYIQRTPLDGAVKLVEIQISEDNTLWKSLGSFTFENIGTKQYLDLFQPLTFRYFKIIVKSDYKNGTATAMAELGVYKK